MCNQRKIGGIFVQLILAAHQGRGGHYGNEDENPNGNKIYIDLGKPKSEARIFFFPHVSSTKLKPLLWIKCVVILMDIHSQLLRVRLED